MAVSIRSAWRRSRQVYARGKDVLVSWHVPEEVRRGIRRALKLRYQDHVSRALQMELRPSSAREWIGNRGLLDATFEEVPRHPGPTDVWWAGAYIGFYRYIAGQGLKTMLTGSGGDEWLGVHPAIAADKIRQLSPARLYKYFRAETTTGGNDPWPAAKMLLWRNGLRMLMIGLAAKLFQEQLQTNKNARIEKHLPGWFCPDREPKG